MPKVIHITIGKANPNRLNGVNKVVHSLAAEAVKLGRPVEVWGLTHDADKSDGVPFPLRLFVVKPWTFQLEPELHQAILAEPHDTIFHFHGGLIYRFWLTGRLLLKDKRRYILTVHGNLQKQARYRKFLLKYMYIRFFERFLLKHAAQVHVITAQEAHDIRTIEPRARLTLIPNGATLPASVISMQSHSAIRFLYMGRFDADHKGLDILIKAFAVFHQTVPSARLFLAGDGRDKSKLKRLITRYHVQTSVRILPPQFNTDKVDLLRQADVFVHPSRWDVMPTGCLEAASHAKPLIVSRQTGMASYIQRYQSGWLTLLNVSNLAQTMHQAYQIWQQGQIGTIGEAARTMVEAELQWSTLCKRFYIEIYDRVKS